MTTERVLIAAGDRYLVTRDPEREREYWRIRGRRWIKSRQAWAQKGVSFLCPDFKWDVSNDRP